MPGRRWLPSVNGMTSTTRNTAPTTAPILAGLAVGPLGIAAADLANPDWPWIEWMASYFVNGRAGWLITLAAVSLAVASASLIGPAAAHTRRHRAGLWLLGIWAVGMLTVGLVPADPPGQWDHPSTANLVHGVAGLAAFVALPTAAALLTRVWRRDERWRPARRWLTVTAAATWLTLGAFAVAWVDVIGGPQLGVGSHPSVAGLLERVMVWSYVGWLAVVAAALHRIRREES